MLKINWFNFFERLARLRMTNIQLIFWTWNRKIPVKWMNISTNWAVEPLNSWYWLYTVSPSHIKWKFKVLPITDSILWTSTERDKTRLLEFAQIVWNMVWDDWKPIINNIKLAETLSRKFNVDFETLTSKNVLNKSWADILKELDLQNTWVAPWSTADPSYIPPEQRSWSKGNVPIIWSSSATPNLM